MTDVVVIGAGKRVKGAILPALWCLRERFRLAAVCSRSSAELLYGPDLVHTTTDWERVRFDGALIIVAVTLEQVPAVLARIDAPNAILLVDTPVFPLRRMVAARRFSAFKRVLVSEDNVALPPLLLARSLIASGELGALRRIFFFHNGYKFHALAGLRVLTGGAALRSIVNRKFHGLRQKTISLVGGVTAVMYEPRDYAVGKFMIECEGGTIADYDHADPPRHRIGYELDGPRYRGLTLDGTSVPAEPLDVAYRQLDGIEVFGAPMNTMKLRGLMDVITGAVEPTSPFHYQPSQAIADALAIKLADRVGYAPFPNFLERIVRLMDRP